MGRRTYKNRQNYTIRPIKSKLYMNRKQKQFIKAIGATHQWTRWQAVFSSKILNTQYNYSSLPLSYGTSRATFPGEPLDDAVKAEEPVLDPVKLKDWLKTFSD